MRNDGTLEGETRELMVQIFMWLVSPNTAWGAQGLAGDVWNGRGGLESRGYFIGTTRKENSMW